MNPPAAPLRQLELSADDARRVETTWRPLPGLRGWLSETGHKAIGRRYLVTAFAFFVLGGLEAVAMRLQLARPDHGLIGPDRYDQLFTMHGSTMMFLFAVPVTQGLAVYLVPLVLGTRDLAFPRLNAFSYYVFLLGGILLYAGFFSNTGPDAGWFAYVPLAGPEFSPGKRVDIWAQLITFTEVAALATAVNLTVTILKMRAPGMSLGRMPIFAWTALVQSLMVIFAMPAIMLASLFLALDRLVGTHFFNHVEGGDPLLWQHLFWFFGHPEVYIIFLPGTGIVSALVSAHAKRPLIGYPAVVLALVTTGFVAFGLWVHHMFATGLPQLGYSFFTAAGMIVAIPTGVQFFCWIATLWGTRPKINTPMLYLIGFFAIFLLGGLSGVMLASVPLDLGVHDTFFVVAHLHYVLIGGMVFPLFAGLHHWWPKITGRMLGERLGTWSFGVMFVGFNLTFFPMHQLGLHGMPRRIYTYPAESGWGLLNLVATLGGAMLAVGVLLFLINAWRSRRPAPANPWGAETLEWQTTSPPPPGNFVHPPTVSSRSPGWQDPPDQPVVAGLDPEKREVLVTTMLDAAPDHRMQVAGPTIWPCLTALALGIGITVGLFTPWGLPLAMVLTAPCFIAWGWPRKPHQELAEEQPT